MIDYTQPEVGWVELTEDGSFIYEPVAEFAGPDTFTYTISDSQGNTDTAIVTIEVTGNFNHPPVAMDDIYIMYITEPGIPFIVNQEQGVLSNDSDPDNDPLEVNYNSLPLNGHVDLSPDGSFTYYPNFGFSGMDTFMYAVSDGKGGLSGATTRIWVLSEYQPPVATDDLYLTKRDTPLVITAPGVLENDSALEYVSLAIAGNTQPVNGTVTMVPDGSFTYTPNSNFTGTDTFTYTISDPWSNTDVATVTIDVYPNRPLVAVDDLYSTVMNAPLVAGFETETPGVLANDGDPDHDSITVINFTQPESGTIEMQGNGSFFYTPDSEFTGTDTCNYTISDGQGGTDDATVTIEVNPNQPPVANDDIVFTLPDTPVTIDVLANDIYSGSLESIFITDFPDHGWAENLGGGLFQYGPLPGYVGLDSFTYRIWDTQGQNDTAVVTIQVGTAGAHLIANDDFAVTDQDTPVTIDVAANDTDEEGDLDPASAVAVTVPEHGILTNNNNGTFTYSPETGYYGQDSFIYQISDIEEHSATATVTIQVNSTNHPPVANLDYVLTEPGATITIDVSANDTDEDGNLEPSSAVIMSPPEHGLINNNNNGTFTYSPSPESYFGPDAFLYEIYDDEGAGAFAAVHISVGDPANNHPSVANDDNVNTEMDSPVDFDATINDTDEDNNLSRQMLTIVLEPENGFVEDSLSYPGLLTYTPSASFSGFDTFTYEIQDSWGLSDYAVVTIRVGTGNYPPVVENQEVSTDEDTSVIIILTGRDADGDTLSFSTTSLPNHGTLTGSGAELTYNPAANYYGTDSFSFQANDGELNSNTAAVIITVNPVNDVPVAQDASYMTDEDAVLNVNATGVLTYDTVDFDMLTAVKVSDPLHGTLMLNPDGSFTYTPDADFYGEDNFTFQANDGQLDSNTSVVTITVNFINDPPVANDDSAVTDEGLAIIIDVAANDTDVDGNLNPASAWAVISPINGTVLSYGDGRLEYTSNAGFYGTDTFTYEIWDYLYSSDTAVVTIDISPVNNPPVAGDQTVTTDEDTPINITLTANDADNDTLTYAVVAGPSHGTLSGLAPDLTYTPALNFSGSDSFTFKASDGQADSNIATVSITLNPINDAPVANNQAVTTDEETAIAINLTASDVEGDPLTYTVVSDPIHGTLGGAAPNLTYTPAANYSGPYSFTFKTNDGQADSNIATVSITVNPVNVNPIVVTSPNGGENWEVFSVQTITWTSTGISSRVKIELSRDGGATWTTIIPVAPNDGKQKWVVLRGDTTQARIKVSSISNPALFDISNADFTIAKSSIKVTFPDGGESWKIGSTQTITWDSTSVLLVKIELSRDGGVTWTTIAASIANHGSKSWKVTGPATNRARIRVVSLSNSASDINNADFTITP